MKIRRVREWVSALARRYYEFWFKAEINEDAMEEAKQKYRYIHPYF